MRASAGNSKELNDDFRVLSYKPLEKNKDYDDVVFCVHKHKPASEYTLDRLKQRKSKKPRDVKYQEVFDTHQDTVPEDLDLDSVRLVNI